MRITFVALKRIFTILLAVVYLAVSSGLIMELHHCMGKLAGSSVSFFGTHQTDKCDNCGMEDKSNNCCKDEGKLVKIQDSQKLVSADNTASVPPIAEAEIVSPLLKFDIYSSSPVTSILGHHPPVLNTPPHSILHCVFRI